MKNSFTTLFFIKKSKADSQKRANIYLRITVNGRRSEFSVKRKVIIDKWNSAANRAKGYSEEALKINQYLDIIQNKIYKIQQNFIETGVKYSALTIRNRYLGTDQAKRMTLKIFEEHNRQTEKLVGKEFAPGTVERYKTAKNHVEDFIKLEYKADDIPINDIDYKFISGFEYYLKSVRNCSHNTAIKYITNFKKIIRIAFANNWINNDPFFNWKGRLKIVDREFLSEEEIQNIIEKEIKIPRLDQVKDIFIFSCFTGLAYADVKKLSQNDIVMGIDGELWIKTKRTKTDTRSNIPILPTAQAIIDKYAKNPIVIRNKVLLPVLSNQKINAYLKEIATICGIKKNLTFHMARHTFATTVTLTNGVPIETVSKLLGHKKLATTQIYAHVIERKVSQDMAALRVILDNKKTNSQNPLKQAH